MAKQQISLWFLARWVLVAAACVLTFLGSCRPANHDRQRDSGGSQAVNENGEEVAQEMSALMPTRDLLLSNEARRVRAYVLKKVAVGEVHGMSQLVLTPGPHRNAKWYEIFAEAFARSMNNCRCRPVNVDHPLEGASEAVAAMKALTESYGGGPAGREVRVLAAAAIRSDEPKLATKVLLEGYANFHVPASDFLMSDEFLPMLCGPVLTELGRRLPKEVNSVDEVKRLLREGPYKFDNNDPEATKKLAAAANAFNLRLRNLLREGKEAELEHLLDWDVRTRLMARLYQNAKQAPRPQIFE